jgi:hypothetical protein
MKEKSTKWQKVDKYEVVEKVCGVEDGGESFGETEGWNGADDWADNGFEEEEGEEGEGNGEIFVWDCPGEKEEGGVEGSEEDANEGAGDCSDPFEIGWGSATTSEECSISWDTKGAEDEDEDGTDSCFGFTGGGSLALGFGSGENPDSPAIKRSLSSEFASWALKKWMSSYVEGKSGRRGGRKPSSLSAQLSSGQRHRDFSCIKKSWIKLEVFILDL